MTQKVQVVLAETIVDAEESRAILTNVGIESELGSAVEHDPLGTDEVPVKVLVDETELESALEAIEALSEPDELTGD
jgi:hypothetical protein